MKMDVRTSVAVCLLAVTVTAAAQNVAQEQTVPAPQQNGPPTPAAPPAQATTPAQNAQPATPPRSQSSPAPQSPVPPQYQYQYSPPPPPPPPSSQSRQFDARQYEKSQWSHTESNWYENTGFKYHPLRFHIDGGGTITQRSNSQLLDNGWNVGAGLSWFPTSHLPLGIRVDGTYMEFTGRQALLKQAAATYGTRVDSATQKVWGGDVDLELDAHFNPYVRMYLVGGGGWYRQQFTYRQRNYYLGLLCDWWGCGPGYYGVNTVVARNTSAWHFAENAGLGFEFAMSPWTSFFVEARYMRVNPKNGTSDYLPIRAGLRF
jgi:opacity protein-like surface antigen